MFDRWLSQQLHLSLALLFLKSSLLAFFLPTNLQKRKPKNEMPRRMSFHADSSDVTWTMWTGSYLDQSLPWRSVSSLRPKPYQNDCLKKPVNVSLARW